MHTTSTGPELSQAMGEVSSMHPEIAVIYLFGSHVRGEARAGSDLDIGIVYRSRQHARRHDSVADDIARAVSLATGVLHVDVVDLEAQGPLFCHRVLQEGQRLLVADEERRIDFESDTIVKGIDFRPTYELAIRDKIGALRRWLKEHHDFGAGSVQARRAEGQSR